MPGKDKERQKQMEVEREHLCKRRVAIDYTLVGGRSVARVSEATGSRFHSICLLPNLQKLVVYW